MKYIIAPGMETTAFGQELKQQATSPEVASFLASVSWEKVEVDCTAREWRIYWAAGTQEGTGAIPSVVCQQLQAAIKAKVPSLKTIRFFLNGVEVRSTPESMLSVVELQACQGSREEGEPLAFQSPAAENVSWGMAEVAVTAEAGDEKDEDAYMRWVLAQREQLLQGQPERVQTGGSKAGEASEGEKKENGGCYRPHGPNGKLRAKGQRQAGSGRDDGAPGKGKERSWCGQRERRVKREKDPDPDVLVGASLKEETPIPLVQIAEGDRGIVVEGEIFRIETRALASGRLMLVWDMTDGSDSLTVKLFGEEGATPELQEGMRVRARGEAQVDKFSGELVFLARDVTRLPAGPSRLDEAPQKRCELHLHTQMSALDATVAVDKAFALASAWGHKALAVTDHGVVQAFPDAYAAGKKYGVKPIYGLEAYLVNDNVQIIRRPPARRLAEASYVVFDVETTGLNPARDEIIEIGAVRLGPDGEKEEFSSFVAPERPLPAEITRLTGITPEMLAGAPPAAQVLPEFFEFAREAVLVAHNAAFDIGFLRAWRTHRGEDFPWPVLDTLNLARALRPQLRHHKLDVLAREFGIALASHHRAGDDARATAELLKCLLQEAAAQGVEDLAGLNSLTGAINLDKLRSYHATILVTSQEGIQNLYRLVSLAHLRYFYRHPRIPRSELENLREGLLVGSACEAGEVFHALLEGAGEEQLLEIASFYDFLEIMPRANNEFLLREGRLRPGQLEELNRRICALGEKLGKPVVATGDVHFLHPQEAIFRQILKANQDYKDVDHLPPLYLRTTAEMLAEFAYLGEELARRVVIDNPAAIADRVEEGIKPVPDELYAPHIEGAEEEIRTMAYANARSRYGDPLPPLVAQRLEMELGAIINHGFAVLYLIAHKLVQKSLQDGYLVGSRGSVGSSFVATMCGITEVNPLPPHYLCAHPDCHYSEFITDGTVGVGVDLPDKLCPRCGRLLRKEGFDIPFAVFMGFHGDKVPDIDLNFSGEYQPVVHKYTEELFGADHVFRAGTIGTLADRTAFAFVKKFLELKGRTARTAEINRLVAGCTGVKRTTGQHPGGVMVVPRDHEIYEFTPIQYPADDRNAGTITTHFDYKSISSRLVKLDILGHDDPTVLRMLQDLTGVNPQEIPLDDPQTLAIFAGVESLGLTPADLGGQTVGTLGIPEFGTRFVRQMLEDTRPRSFSELVRISGFSHGTDVWLGNAQDLIKNGICSLGEAISTRDDIMSYLIYHGVEAGKAFKLMEQVRKGKGLKPEDVEFLQESGIPTWFIEACRKIKYLFPKAHAVAYVTMAFRIAWFKVHHPAAFYASYFTVRAEEFDAEIVRRGPAFMRQTLESLERKGNSATAKEKNLAAILEVALEAVARGIAFLPVDLYQSDVKRFKIVEETQLLPPLAALQGLGEAAAMALVEARTGGPFTSIEDLRNRARVSKTVIDVLRQHGCLEGLPETSQLTLAL